MNDVKNLFRRKVYSIFQFHRKPSNFREEKWLWVCVSINCRRKETFRSFSPSATNGMFMGRWVCNFFLEFIFSFRWLLCYDQIFDVLSSAQRNATVVADLFNVTSSLRFSISIYLTQAWSRSAQLVYCMVRLQLRLRLSTQRWHERMKRHKMVDEEKKSFRKEAKMEYKIRTTETKSSRQKYASTFHVNR